MLTTARGAAARAWVEVDLDAVRRNAEAVRRRAGVPIVPMVKADAYGLGAVPVARALEPLDPWAFGVATVAEGEELRAAGIARPILVFTPLPPCELPAARAARLTPVLGDPAAIAAWARGGRDPWHLGIDTGMSRAGIRWDEVGALRDLVAELPPQGACTHFHSAQLDDDSRDVQERRFADALAALPARPSVTHVENSAAVERRAPSRWSLARPGIFLYGVGCGNGAVEPDPVVALRARVVELRAVEAGESVSYDATWRASSRRRVATLAIGYADGYRRALGNRAAVLVGGTEVPVIGVVTMDMTMIDVTDVPCAVGDVATLIGADGGRRLSVAEVARAGGLSPYELLTGLRSRVTRLYAGGGSE
ncbi:MAG: alanine racemase [Gemmatimonadaceae bacterium]